MERMGIRRGGLLLMVAVFGLASVLGGCSAEKKRADAAQAEAAELREKNAQLEQANRDTAARLAELEAKQNQSGGGMDEGGTPPSNTSRTFVPRAGNEGSMFKRNRETGQMDAEIAGDVLFASGSDVIKPEARKTLDKVASEIKSQYGGASVRVEGYTDSDPLVKTKAKWGSNEKLSQARAEAVRKYLISKGIKSSRVEAMGYGSAKPKATKAQSRRVEIVIVQ